MYTTINDLDDMQCSNTGTYFETDKTGLDGNKSPLNNMSRIRVPLLLMGGILSLILFFIGWPSFTETPLTSSAECRVCSFRECQRSLCDRQIAPFVCIEGAAHDGCASTSDAWIGNSVCEGCCDASNCDTTEKSFNDDVLTLCPPCTQLQCDVFSPKCDDKDPYVCLEGGARYGCTSEIFHWPTALNGICTECCDLTLC